MQQIPMVDLKAQMAAIRQEIRDAVDRVLDHAQFILGPEVEAFEEGFAAYCGVSQAVGVNSGTAALQLALMALEVGPGDEVITSSHTFVATSEAISLTGARPVYADIDEKTFTLDPQKIETLITPKTRGIIPVHIYGHPADMDAILAVARRHHLFVLEDAAQAHGALYKGRRAGSFGDAAAFSFFPGKNLGAYGEAGGVVTNNADLALKIKKLRNHGRLGREEHSLLGMNARMEGLQAAVLRVKLKYIDQWNALRRQHARIYSEQLKEVGLILPCEAAHVESVFHLYVIRSQQRDELLAFLNEKGIKSHLHYETPNHLMPYYRKEGWKEGDLPVTEKIYREILSLPIFPELTGEQIRYITDAIMSFQTAQAAKG